MVPSTAALATPETGADEPAAPSGAARPASRLTRARHGVQHLLGPLLLVALTAWMGARASAFSGTPKGTATIVFSAKAARWVADEHWHSKQEGRFLPDGRYQLKLPYSNAKELLMDVLRYGADAEITEPVALREQAKTLLQLALAAYGGSS